MHLTIIEELRARRKMMTVKELKDLLDNHQQTVYEWVWAGKIPAHRVGGRIKFDPASASGRFLIDLSGAGYRLYLYA
jgi:excisionase family DNA binding protein